MMPEIHEAMVILNKSPQLDTFRPHLDLLCEAIVKMDDELLKLKAKLKKQNEMEGK